MQIYLPNTTWLHVGSPILGYKSFWDVQYPTIGSNIYQRKIRCIRIPRVLASVTCEEEQDV
jgi:hypothetical protein